MSITESRCAYCDQPLDLKNAKTNEAGQACSPASTNPALCAGSTSGLVAWMREPYS